MAKPAAFIVPVGPDGSGETEIRPRCTMYEMRAFLAAYARGIGELQASAAALAAVPDGDDPSEAIAAEREASGQIEAICGHAVLLTWAGDDLDARVAWLRKEFAIARNPVAESGAAAVREMVDAGWDPSAVMQLGRACADYLIERIGLSAPKPEEVSAKIETFPQAGEQTT